MSEDISKNSGQFNDTLGIKTVALVRKHPAHLDSSSEEGQSELMGLLQQTAVAASGLSDATLHISTAYSENSGSSSSNDLLGKQHAYVVITEQPSDLGLEKVLLDPNHSALIRGTSSTFDKPTVPTIKVMECSCPAVVVVSCVSGDGAPHPCPHPLELHHDRGTHATGGVYVTHVDQDMTCVLPGLMLRLAEPSRHSEALKAREGLHIDPYKTGFNVSRSLDLKSFRLCFQVFLEGPERGRFSCPLLPAVSERLYLRVGDEQPPEAEVNSALENEAAGGSAHLSCVDSENQAQCPRECEGGGVGAGPSHDDLHVGDDASHTDKEGARSQGQNQMSCKMNESDAECSDSPHGVDGNEIHVNGESELINDLRGTGRISTSNRPRDNDSHKFIGGSYRNTEANSRSSPVIVAKEQTGTMASNEPSEGRESSAEAAEQQVCASAAVEDPPLLTLRNEEGRKVLSVKVLNKASGSVNNKPNSSFKSIKWVTTGQLQKTYGRTTGSFGNVQKQGPMELTQAKEGNILKSSTLTSLTPLQGKTQTITRAIDESLSKVKHSASDDGNIKAKKTATEVTHAPIKAKDSSSSDILKEVQLDMTDDGDDSDEAQTTDRCLDNSSETGPMLHETMDSERSDSTTASGSDRKLLLEQANLTKPTESTRVLTDSRAGGSLTCTKGTRINSQGTSLHLTGEKPRETVLDEEVLFQLESILTSKKAVNSPVQNNCEKLVEGSHAEVYGETTMEKKIVESPSSGTEVTSETMNDLSVPLKSTDDESNNSELLKSSEGTPSLVSSSDSIVRKNIILGSKSGRQNLAKSLHFENLGGVLANPNEHGSSVEATRAVTSEDVTFCEVSSTVEIPATVESTRTFESRSGKNGSSVREGGSEYRMKNRIIDVAPDPLRQTSLSPDPEIVPSTGVNCKSNNAGGIIRDDIAVLPVMNGCTEVSPNDAEFVNKRSTKARSKNPSAKDIPYRTEVENKKQLKGEKAGVSQGNSSHDKLSLDNHSINDVEEELRKKVTDEAVGNIDTACKKTEDYYNRRRGFEGKEKREEREGGLQNRSSSRAFHGSLDRGSSGSKASSKVDNLKLNCSNEKRVKEQSQHREYTKNTADDSRRERRHKKDYHGNRRGFRSSSADRKTERESHGRNAKNANDENRCRENTAVSSKDPKYMKEAVNSLSKSRTGNHDPKKTRDSSSCSTSNHCRDSSVSHGREKRHFVPKSGSKEKDRHGSRDSNSSNRSKAESGLHKRRHEEDKRVGSPGHVGTDDKDCAKEISNEGKELKCGIGKKGTEEAVVSDDNVTDSKYKVCTFSFTVEDSKKVSKQFSDEESECESKKPSSKSSDKTSRKISIDSESEDDNRRSIDKINFRGQRKLDALGSQSVNELDESKGDSSRATNDIGKSVVDMTETHGNITVSGKEIVERNKLDQGKGRYVRSTEVGKNLKKNLNDTTLSVTSGVIGDDVSKLLHNGCTIRQIGCSNEMQRIPYEDIESEAYRKIEDFFSKSDKVCEINAVATPLTDVEITRTQAVTTATKQKDRPEFSSHPTYRNDDIRLEGKAGEICGTEGINFQKDKSKKRIYTEMTDGEKALHECKKRVRVLTTEKCETMEENRCDGGRDDPSAKKYLVKHGAMSPKGKATQAIPAISAAKVDAVEGSSLISGAELPHEKCVEFRNGRGPSGQLSQNDSESEMKSSPLHSTMDESFSSDTSLHCIDKFSGLNKQERHEIADDSLRSSKVSVVVEKLDLSLLGGMTTIDLSQPDIDLSPSKHCESSSKTSPIKGFDGTTTNEDHRRKLFTPLKNVTSTMSVSPFSRLSRNTSITISGTQSVAGDHCTNSRRKRERDDLHFESSVLESRSHQKKFRATPRSVKNSMDDQSPVPLAQSGPSSGRGKETTATKINSTEKLSSTSELHVQSGFVQRLSEKRFLSETDDHSESVSMKKCKVDPPLEVNWIEILHENWESVLSTSMKRAEQNLTLRKACERPKLNLTILSKYPFASAHRGSYKYPRLWNNTYTFISRTGNTRYRMNEMRFVAKSNQPRDRKRLPHLRKSTTSKRRKRPKKIVKDQHKTLTGTLSYEAWKKCVLEDYNLRRVKGTPPSVNDEVSNDSPDEITSGRKSKLSKLTDSGVPRTKEKSQDNIAHSIERVLLRVRRNINVHSSETSTCSDLPSPEKEKCNGLETGSNEVAPSRKSCASIENGENLKHDNNQNNAGCLSDIDHIDDEDPQCLLSQKELDCISRTLCEEGFLDVDTMSCKDFSGAESSSTSTADEEKSDTCAVSSQGNGNKKSRHVVESLGKNENSCAKNSVIDVKRLTSRRISGDDGRFGKTTLPNSVGARSLSNCSLENEKINFVDVSSQVISPERTANISRVVDEANEGITSPVSRSATPVESSPSTRSASPQSSVSSGLTIPNGKDYANCYQSSVRTLSDRSLIRRNGISSSHYFNCENITPDRNAPQSYAPPDVDEESKGKCTGPVNVSMKKQLSVSKGSENGPCITSPATSSSAVKSARASSGLAVASTSAVGEDGRSQPRGPSLAPAPLRSTFKGSSRTQLSVSKVCFCAYLLVQL